MGIRESFKRIDVKNVLITGATGMIGNLVCRYCLDREDVSKVISVSRRSSSITDPKFKEIIHEDFLNLETITECFEEIDVCFFCIGVYTGQVPTEEFQKITVDYTRAFVLALKTKSPNSTFCFLSGQGADSSESSRVLFAREKGKAENLLLAAEFPRTHIFRPGYIYPVQPRKEPNIGYAVLRGLYRPLSLLFPNMGVTSEKLAQTMVTVGFQDNNQVYFENSDIRLHTG